MRRRSGTEFDSRLGAIFTVMYSLHLFIILLYEANNIIYETDKKRSEFLAKNL